MGRARGRVVFGIVATAHAALFVLLALDLRPQHEALAPEVAVVPVYLADLRREPPRTAPPRP